ncbi:MAG: thiol peroxidase [Aminobacterium sp.]|jgi:thiol peroxidase|uniref:thiol peroxidase n=1 Tax=unclassified Aminobacterium TaxID=2685012 RepID=UPI001BCD9DB5|nr:MULTISPECIES: thiol peroxidase [unclassified Aminobacterium]MDD2206703.1 thiol peroxidase [Aminobacterium sp.]MDD3425301.1 thiol peroxidase [Aminobacterium sp.]MDD3706878.1 thiol peroxidase [Aminobacterium sp.]MDD4228865.1 thiol peroxidase [Aminobacterium sp.]MDD4551062.1 thiol peroxidase [Aminobacterium sp.]
MEKTGIVTMKGNPLTLIGPALSIGDKAPEFNVLDQNLTSKTLRDFSGCIKVISVTPSLDTPVCDLQIHWFNEDAANQPDDVAILNISMDLPFALKRFCATKGIESAIALSDHRDASFGTNWGVLIKELRLLTRAVFIADKDDIIRYIEIVPEATNEPDYEKALQALETIVR